MITHNRFNFFNNFFKYTVAHINYYYKSKRVQIKLYIQDTIKTSISYYSSKIQTRNK